MSTATIAEPTIETLADLVRGLGDIPLERIRFCPLPGAATEADIFAPSNRMQRHCELVDRVLVEKPMGYYESRLAAVLIGFLEAFLGRHDLGIVIGEGGTLRLAPGLIRIPDVSFLSWSHFPNRLLPAEQMPDLTPDLAVEVLSPSNTRAEMARKRREYFAGGCQLVWEVDPVAVTVTVYTAPDQSTVLTENDSVDGGAVLPGFSLSIRQWFARAGRRQGP
jgi:Uma2 family endonuclease